MPGAKRGWALPFLPVRCWPPRAPHKRRHQTSVDWGRQMTKQGRRWRPERRLGLGVDGGFAAVALALAWGEREVGMGARWRLGAALYPPPAPQPPGKRGRKPTQGKRQRSLAGWAARSDTPWEQAAVDWSGGQRQALGVFSRTALWATPGWAAVALRFVVVRDPEGRLPDAAFFCTDLHATPEQILQWVGMRWAVEVTFAEARAHLGLETQRQGSDRAIARTTPVLLGLFSLVTVLTVRLRPNGEIPVETTAWYHKVEPPFADCLTLVRRHLWRARYFVHSAHQAEYVQLPREAVECLLNDLPLAA